MTLVFFFFISIFVSMTTSVLFSVLMAISSIQSSGCISIDESDFGEISYSPLDMPVGILPFKVRNNASVYVSIEGYLNTDPISGPYRSSLVQLNTSSIGSIVRGDLIPIVSIIGG